MVATFAETQRNKHAVTPSALRRDLNLNIYPTSFTPPPPHWSQSHFPLSFLTDILSKAVKVDSLWTGGWRKKKRQWKHWPSNLPTCTAMLLLQRKGWEGGLWVCVQLWKEWKKYKLRNKNKEQGEKKAPGGAIIFLFSLSLSASCRNVRMIKRKCRLHMCEYL